VPVSLNVSRMDFDLENLKEILVNLVDKYKVPHDLIHFEITESAFFMNEKAVYETIDYLHKQNFKIELDDFGAGYSTIVFLAHVKLDILKLDMSLVKEIEDPKVSIIIKSIIEMAKDLGLKVVAEGCETKNQLDLLKNMNCDYIQGFYYSMPVKKEEFFKMLDK
jgi:EAL domain-containing protein (putative c-di-GMP-specific phosphodiesterase class I)